MNIIRHEATPNFIEFKAEPDKSDGIDKMSATQLRAAYADLHRKNQELEKQVSRLRLRHYQALASMAGPVVGEVKHSQYGVRVALTAAGMALPQGTLLMAMPKEGEL